MLFTMRSESNHGQTFENEGTTEMKDLLEKAYEEGHRITVEPSPELQEQLLFGSREYQVLETLNQTYKGNITKMTNSLCLSAGAYLRSSLKNSRLNKEEKELIDRALIQVNRIALINGGFEND